MDYLVKYLDTYGLDEILEQNDLTAEDVLLILIELKHIRLPDPRPVDWEDD